MTLLKGRSVPNLVVLYLLLFYLHLYKYKFLCAVHDRMYDISIL